MSMPANNGGKPTIFFADRYHNLKITQKMSEGWTVYHRTNTVVLTGDIPPALDNITLDATADHIHMDHPMETIRQLIKRKNILGDHIKHMAENNTILERQGKYKKK